VIRIGIVGCGEIAKKHINFIKQLKNAEIVGIVDQNRKVLNEVSKKYNIQNIYQDVNELIAAQAPNVLHILTPPKFHNSVALDAIHNKVNVYIEKPISLGGKETREIYDNAQENNIKICAGYNHLYDPCMRKADAFIQQGRIGEIVHLVSYYGMNVARRDLQSTTSDNRTHWSYDLPGGLFHNYIDHPLYLLLYYIGQPEEIRVVTHSHEKLPQGMADELRVLIKGKEISGMLIISFNAKPQLHYLEVFGNRGYIKVNFDTMSTVLHSPSALPKAASKATFNLNEAYQLIIETIRNSFGLIRGTLKPYQGMKDLIQNFYSSILNHLPSPVSNELAINVSDTIDQIWSQAENLHLNFDSRTSSQKNITKRKKILVTGASGFLGYHTVRRLVDEGYYVRVFVRKLSHIKRLEDLGVEIVFGDIRNYESFEQAMKEMDVVIHLAADTTGHPDTSSEVTVTGTQNLIDLSIKNGIKQVIYMSSMSVYDTVHAKDYDRFDENAKLEPHPQARGAYANSKSEAERFVLERLSANSQGWSILRPAMIFGPETNMFFGSLGLKVGNKFVVVFGNGKRRIRLIHVDDVVEAIILCLQKPDSRGKIYNLVHDEMISKREYLEKFFYPNLGDRRAIYFPYPLLMFLTVIQEWLFKLLSKSPILTRYRLSASQREIIFSTERIKNELGWQPEKPLRKQLELSFKKK
jgi:nucleoside-diphosphate-sugar epimerase/predicted dehydrogenase